MASRGFFGYDPYSVYGYDPYDHYYTAAPYNYPYYDAYFQRQPASSSTRSRRSKSKGIYEGSAAAVKPSRRERDTKTSFEIPVTGPDSDPKPAMSAEQAAVRIQAAARGFLARKSVREVRSVEGLVGQVLAQISTSEAEAAMVADPTARASVAELLMRMLLRLDEVRGARGYRRRITKRVLAMQDAVDALETTTQVAEVDDDAHEAAAAAAVEVAEECAVVPDAADERGSEKESIMFMVVDVVEPEAGEKQGDADVDDVDDEPEEGSEADGEWEMVITEEDDEHNTAPVAATSDDDDDQEPPRKEPACLALETTNTTTTASAGADGVDARKVMQMVAALCEQSAQQCAVIGKLAERVEALERTVRRMEDAETRRRGKKLSEEDN